jgi:hypothetical protein
VKYELRHYLLQRDTKTSPTAGIKDNKGIKIDNVGRKDKRSHCGEI